MPSSDLGALLVYMNSKMEVMFIYLKIKWYGIIKNMKLYLDLDLRWIKMYFSPLFENDVPVVLFRP